MPKAPAKKSVKPMKRKSAAPKLSAKPKIKMKMKAKPKAKAAPPERSFMWKLLKRKEEERKMHQKNASNPSSPNPDGPFKTNVRPLSFTKFAGPRRRIG